MEVLVSRSGRDTAPQSACPLYSRDILAAAALGRWRRLVVACSWFLRFGLLPVAGFALRADFDIAGIQNRAFAFAQVHDARFGEIGGVVRGGVHQPFAAVDVRLIADNKILGRKAQCGLANTLERFHPLGLLIPRGAMLAGRRLHDAVPPAIPPPLHACDKRSHLEALSAATLILNCWSKAALNSCICS